MSDLRKPCPLSKYVPRRSKLRVRIERCGNRNKIDALADMLDATERAIGNASQDKHGDWIVSRESMLRLHAAIAKAKGEA